MYTLLQVLTTTADEAARKHGFVKRSKNMLVIGSRCLKT